ncbi:hypothetical protein [Leptospira stimsonii]|nr:hypothetical protein [Leptospira stimsonii]
MKYECLSTDLKNGIFVETLNRPQKSNAINKQIREEWENGFDSNRENDHVSGIVLSNLNLRKSRRSLCMLCPGQGHTGSSNEAQKQRVIEFFSKEKGN